MYTDEIPSCYMYTEMIWLITDILSRPRRFKVSRPRRLNFDSHDDPTKNFNVIPILTFGEYTCYWFYVLIPWNYLQTEQSFWIESVEVRMSVWRCPVRDASLSAILNRKPFRYFVAIYTKYNMPIAKVNAILRIFKFHTVFPQLLL